MGGLIDEGTNEPPECPFCGVSADEGCEHALALLDMTFGECRGGYCDDHLSEIGAYIRAAFASVSPTVEQANLQWSDALIQELWEGLDQKESRESADNIYLDSHEYMRFVAELLEEAGGKRHPGSLLEDDGPGVTSAMELFYAKDPRAVTQAALEAVQSRLILEEASDA